MAIDRTDLDRRLQALADLLDIPDSLYEQAKERYESLGKWLHRKESVVVAFAPAVYPQGSFRLGTVVRPLLRSDEYDLDLVCQMAMDKSTTTQKIVKELVGHEVKAYAETMAQKEGRSVTGQPTGFHLLDTMTGGLQKGDLIILAARPSEGKTSLLLNIIEHLAIVEQSTVALFSLELSKDQLARRFLTSRARVSLRQIYRRVIVAEDWARLQQAASDLAKARILIDDSPSLSISQLRVRARRFKSEHTIQCIFVDCLQLIGFHGRSENRQAEVAEICRGLKALARELEMPVVITANLNHKPPDPPTYRPRLSELREVGFIEQYADVVALLHSEDYYHLTEEDYSPAGITELIVAKQQNGPTSVVPLVFHAEFVRFDSAAPGTCT